VSGVEGKLGRKSEDGEPGMFPGPGDGVEYSEEVLL